MIGRMCGNRGQIASQGHSQKSSDQRDEKIMRPVHIHSSSFDFNPISTIPSRISVMKD